MVKVAICDDETGTCADLENKILSYAKSHAVQIETEVFYSGESLYGELKKSSDYDLVFLDIQLVTLDGVLIGRQIRDELENEKISIVYISSKESYAMSLFQVRPMDFLIKPISEENMTGILDKFFYLMNCKAKDFLCKVGKSIVKTSIDEILYFECSGKKIKIHSSRGQIEFYGTMQEVWEQTQGHGFWMIHKSYIVNSAFVLRYSYDTVCMTDEAVLPISQKYRKTMKDCLADMYRKGSAE